MPWRTVLAMSWSIGALSFDTVEDEQAPPKRDVLSMRIDRKRNAFERIEVDLSGFDHEIKGDVLVLTPKAPETDLEATPIPDAPLTRGIS